MQKHNLPFPPKQYKLNQKIWTFLHKFDIRLIFSANRIWKGSLFSFQNYSNEIPANFCIQSVHNDLRVVYATSSGGLKIRCYQFNIKLKTKNKEIDKVGLCYAMEWIAVNVLGTSNDAVNRTIHHHYKIPLIHCLSQSSLKINGKKCDGNDRFQNE